MSLSLKFMPKRIIRRTQAMLLKSVWHCSTVIQQDWLIRTGPLCHNWDLLLMIQLSEDGSKVWKVSVFSCAILTMVNHQHEFALALRDVIQHVLPTSWEHHRNILKNRLRRLLVGFIAIGRNWTCDLLSSFLVFCPRDREDVMRDPAQWFENVTINGVAMSAFNIDSVSQFTPNLGGVTFDNRAPFPTINLLPRGQRGSFAALGFNNNPKRPNNIRSAQLALTLKEGSRQVYSVDGPNNLLAELRYNYDVTRVTMQIMSTTDGQPANNVEIIAIACAAGLLLRMRFRSIHTLFYSTTIFNIIKHNER